MTTLAADDFNRANENPVATTSSGHTWAHPASGNQVISNKLASTSTTQHIGYISDMTDTADVSVTLTWSSPGGGYFGVIARYQTTGADRYGFWTRASNGGYEELYKVVSSSFTSLGQGGNAAQAGDIYKLECIGSAIKVYKNGSATALLSVTDSGVTASGKAGVESLSVGSTPRFDDFLVETAGGGAAAVTFVQAYIF